jgi:hypothetical protein
MNRYYDQILDVLREPAREEVMRLMGQIPISTLTAEELIGLSAYYRPIVERLQAPERPVAELRLMRS